MYYQDASCLDTAGRLLLVAFFLAVGIRNLQRQHVDDHIKRLTNFKTPFPKMTFWIGPDHGIRRLRCSKLVNWHPAIGVLLLLVFTIAASAPALAVLAGRGTDAHSRLQNGMLANIGIVIGGLLLLLQHVR